MKTNYHLKLAALVFVFAFFAGSANAQWGSPNAYGYNTGYGAVYGTFRHAALMQSMYNVTRSEQLNRARQGSAAKQPPSRAAGSQAKDSPAPIVRNYGVFRPDPAVDTGKLMAESLGSSPEEKALIKSIYTATKDAYEQEAAGKGWTNNIAGGLTFFTIASVAVYHDAEPPGEVEANNYFQAVNASIDEIAGFGNIPNKEKQSFNNMMVGFSGMLLAIYMDAKESGNAESLANSKKLAGMMIEMVLKADPENIRIENGKIVMK